jgi:hypothetical protein
MTHDDHKISKGCTKSPRIRETLEWQWKIVFFFFFFGYVCLVKEMYSKIWGVALEKSKFFLGFHLKKKGVHFWRKAKTSKEHPSLIP